MSQQDTPEVLKTDAVSFSSDSKLLSEIGERLIATSEIALSELIKNAYDADATKCNIWLSDDELIVKDDGHGMTETEFRNYWMTIATTSRLQQETSRRYNRELTGAKGVGRFAVRNLGLELDLDTVAYYPEVDAYRRLVATFRWGDFESGETLQHEDVEYRIEEATEEERGTELRIGALQDDWTQSDLEEVSGEVLDIISAPYQDVRSELDTTEEPTTDREGMDPGFRVYFAPPGEGSPTKSAAQEIYERYVGEVEITVDGSTLTYHCEYPYGYDDGEAEHREYRFTLDENLVGDIDGQIRYFNQNYAGVFRGMDTIDGRSAPKWLRDNGGIRVIDKHFRVPPYGDQGNDWLNISESRARRERRWRSSFVSELFPGDEENEEKVRNSQLNLPAKNQVLGAVNVSSYRPGEDETDSETDRPNRLVPAMDRQGFVENAAMEQLIDITRGAMEIIAVLDYEETLRREQEEVEESASDLKEEIQEQKKALEEEVDNFVNGLTESETADLSSNTASTTGSSDDGQFTFDDLRGESSSAGSSSNADDDVATESENLGESASSEPSSSVGSEVSTESPSVSESSTSSAGEPTDVRDRFRTELKPQIRESYTELQEKVEKYEQAREELRGSVESMYLMSAVAAFMTHETSELLRCADEMIEVWEDVPESERSPELEERLAVTREAREKFEKQLGYAKRFMSGLEENTQSELYVHGKVDEVVEQFDHYTDRKNIEVEYAFEKRLKTPKLNPSIYTGVLMNLFTNAMKATLDVAPEERGRHIRFNAENTEGWHKLRVADTGSGIPEGVEERIFDPLFSTTDTREDDPLGGGVGLGLYVVQRVVESSGGEIEVVEAPDGFETCFEVRFER
ncbi:sensor histidine kinase [Natrinema ejinorense]|uniref:Histidine kinase domain-containing protein n=1 Tax=Natrinema ejinorense TaxID=373386 RepID=A0A2A5QRR6_9EURY|nr:sensor histidine kinase [Natrinema ejinorense]PCR89453.1 hypothetical protein CP557_02205 [Natrinema ejinorense]